MSLYNLKTRGRLLSVRRFIGRHSLALLYTSVILLIAIGLIFSTGFSYIPSLFLHAFTFLAVYCGLSFLMRNRWRGNPSWFDINFMKNRKTSFIVAFVSFVGIVVFIVYHLLFLGHVPIYSAFKSLDYYGIALIRQDITAHGNTFIHYASSLLLKAVLPFFMLLFFIRKKWIFILLMCLGLFYALAMMQKGMVVSLFTPLIVFLIIKRKYLASVVFAVCAIAGVMVMIIIASPPLRATEDEIAEYMRNHRRTYVPENKKVTPIETMTVTSNALFHRIVFTTGRDVSRWFELIPSQLPYARGCGYRFVAPLLGCDSEDFKYDRIIWDILNVVEHNEGLRGSSTSAFFMYDYANFGKAGLVMAGAMLALLFVFLNLIYNKQYKWLASINALYILWLSNVALYTLLLSGGWILTAVLFVLFRPSLENY